MFTVSIITSMQMLFTAQPSIFLSFLLIQLLVLPGINHSFSLSLLNFFDSFLESTVRSPHIFLQLYTCLSTQLYTWWDWSENLFVSFCFQRHPFWILLPWDPNCAGCPQGCCHKPEILHCHQSGTFLCLSLSLSLSHHSVSSYHVFLFLIVVETLRAQQIFQELPYISKPSMQLNWG